MEGVWEADPSGCALWSQGQRSNQGMLQSISLEDDCNFKSWQSQTQLSSALNNATILKWLIITQNLLKKGKTRCFG